MKRSLISPLLVALALAGTAHAQLTLHDFSSLASPQTLFFGDWSDTGDPFVGSTTPAPSFSQGAGFFNLAGASNADASFFEHTFAAALDLGSASQLSFSLRLLDGNTADSLTVFLFDGGARSAFATFLASDFSAAAFSERTLAFTAEAGFELSNVTSFRISGNDPFASGAVGFALDNLAVTAPRGAVPEPATYGLFGAAVLGVFALRRRAQEQPRQG